MLSAPSAPDARFAFGANWSRFISVVNDERIAEAELSLKAMLETPLAGKRFLDIGCGSGLFSLAARRLGADVVSFDFDPLSVACTEEMKRRYRAGDEAWRIECGSVLDEAYLRSLGTFDVVYSWGVLHHTGAIWRALEGACEAVNPGGRLFVALYNDQGWLSVWWTHVKRVYNVLPSPLRRLYLFMFAALLESAAAVVALARCEPRRIVERWTRYQSVRGMSRWHDLVDRVGGYPFEVATPVSVVDFCQARGFKPQQLKTCGRKMGCNEFVFIRTE